ncbi:nuclear transport factor 2 family protein [Chloroflexi bacterium TSY]|nr:nuclear transport factor 2 family protein [Chloroflexi bacterium TSY]
MTHEMIINTVNQMALAADLRDWELCRTCFADRVYVDYTSLADGEPATIPADALMEAWQALLPGFTATQHLIGSHVVDQQGHTAECRAHFQSTHILDDEQWVLGGHYQYRLQRSDKAWRITAITMTALWSVGDQAKLFQLATERASQH